MKFYLFWRRSCWNCRWSGRWRNRRTVWGGYGRPFTRPLRGWTTWNMCRLLTDGWYSRRKGRRLCTQGWRVGRLL